jgi:glyoxylase-like metal-dependent hydrolase (beta-lactamase superfamily II)
MNMSPSNIDFEINEPTPRTVVANYKPFFSVNAGAIALDDFAIIIDSLLFPRQAKRLREYVESKFGVPVKYLFITHFHGDHIYGAATFRDIEIFGSNALIERMKRKMKEGWKKEDFDKWREDEPEFVEYIDEVKIVLPTVGFEKERIISNNDLEVEFYLSGGHSGCSSHAYFPSEKVVFVGDDLATKEWPYIFEPCGDQEKWMQAFERILGLDVDVVVPGHGAIVGPYAVKEYLDYLRKLKTAVVKAISEGKGPDDIEIPEFYEPAADWQIPEARKFLHEFYSNET